MKKVSIVLPTYNRLHRLRQVLEAMQQQTFPCSSYEVIVVSDGSTDGTNEYLQRCDPPFHLVPVVTPNRGAAAARNCGLSHATGEIVLFLDDDVVPAPQLIREHVDCHRLHQNVVVIGPMLTPPDHQPAPWLRWMHERLAEQYEAMATAQWEPTARQFYTGNASILRHFLIESGGFDSAFARAEDVELAYRLADRGLRFLFNPRAIGYHYEERSFSSWTAIPYAYGRNDVIFAQEKGQVWLLDTMGDEFASRHAIHRLLVRLTVDRPVLMKPVLACFNRLGNLGARGGLPSLQRFAYSSIFNLRYYEGVVAALGGRSIFSARIDRASATCLSIGGT